MRFRMLKFGAAGAAAIVALTVAAVPASATGSVVGADTKTKEVGGALATCTATFANFNVGFVHRFVYRSVPGVGVIHGQSQFLGNKVNAMVDMIGAGATPRAIIAELRRANDPLTPDPASPLYEGKDQNTGERFVEHRQYLVASTDPAALPDTFTGTSDTDILGTLRARGSLIAARQPFHAAIGGNILTSTGVLLDMHRGFVQPMEQRKMVRLFERILKRDIARKDEAKLGANNLANRLFRSLAEGFDRPAQGDKRCIEHGRSADTAWLRVDAPAGTTIDLQYSYSCDPRQGDPSCSLGSPGDALRNLTAMYFNCLANRGPCVSTVFNTEVAVVPSSGQATSAR
ncbi:MAG: hypothetical protein ACT4OX_04835 [Actinomycetota bacterium]